MISRLRLLVLFAIAAISVAVAATAALGGAVTGPVRVVGPYEGADQRAFQSVLAAFQRENPGVRVTYQATPGAVPAALAAGGAQGADLAILQLPFDRAAMTTLARKGAIKPLGFVAPVVDANYAFSFKRLGSVDGKLYGVFAKATNRSAFWYDKAAFEAAGVTPPRTLLELKQVVAKLEATGRKPFAIGGLGGVILPALFQNAYLTLQGSQRYDRLANGELSWTDGSVKDSLRTMRNQLSNPARIAGGVEALQNDLSMAVQQVFGSPSRAAAIVGGSALLPVLNRAKAVRPLAKFGAFSFPQLEVGVPPRVIGDADAVVMTRDTPAARALVTYLAGPEAATVWAASDPYYISPNRKVNPAAYGSDVVRTLATALAGAPTFRFSAVQMQPAAEFAGTFTGLVREFVRNPGALDRITAALDRAAKSGI